MAAATDTAPSVISSRVVAYPRSRTPARHRRSLSGSAIVCSVIRGRPRAMTSSMKVGGAYASRTLPTPVACSGSRLPGRLTDRDRLEDPGSAPRSGRRSGRGPPAGRSRGSPRTGPGDTAARSPAASNGRTPGYPAPTASHPRGMRPSHRAPAPHWPAAPSPSRCTVVMGRPVRRASWARVRPVSAVRRAARIAKALAQDRASRFPVVAAHPDPVALPPDDPMVAGSAMRSMSRTRGPRTGQTPAKTAPDTAWR